MQRPRCINITQLHQFTMSDVIYLLLTIVSFGILLLFVKACEKV